MQPDSTAAKAPPLAPAASAAGAPAPPVPLWKTISSLRGLAMTLVVANHAIQASSGLLAIAHPTVAPGTSPFAFLFIFVLRTLTPVCLVAFFFASGFMTFRFFANAKASRVAALQLLRKYLLWSVAMFVLAGLAHRRVEWRALPEALLRGNVRPAYWFLLVIIVLVAAAPPLVRLVKAHPRAAVAGAAGLQIASCVLFYAHGARSAPSPWALFVLRPAYFLPQYVAGMLLSRDADRVSAWLHAHRRLLASLAAAAAALTLLEASALWANGGFRLDHNPLPFATERATLVAFASLGIASLLTTRLGQRRFAGWLGEVGNASLGVMLLMDACMAAVMTAAWRLPQLLWPSGALPQAHGLAAPIADHALWLTPALFAAGLWGPLLLMKLGRRIAGNRVRYLW